MSTERTMGSRVVRTHRGNWLGGVCAGLPRIAGLGTWGLRALFCIGALCGGVGVIVYAACWLVIPLDQTGDEQDGEARPVVVLAWASGALVAVVLVCGAAAMAAAFGFGWVVCAIAAALLLLAASARVRVPALAVLVAIGALTLPAVAVSLARIRIAPEVAPLVSRPASTEALSRTVYRSGLGTQLIDLRRTGWPARGTVRLRIDAGLRRTIVALPADRCVAVRLRYAVHPFADRLAAFVSGSARGAFPDVVLFGRVFGAPSSDPHGVAAAGTDHAGLTLVIDFRSLGGGLYVRDYPDATDPDEWPDWPGYLVPLQPRPNTRGDSRRQVRRALRVWRAQHHAELASRRAIDRLLPGPCEEPA